MTKRLRFLLLLALTGLAVLAAGALAESVRLTPVRGATYRGELLHAGTISLKVAGNGGSAKISLVDAPSFCAGSGEAPEPRSAKPAKISKHGALSDTITYFSGGINPQTLAKVLVKGNFYKYGSSTPVFQGYVKSTFPTDSGCNGQESFEAVKR